MNPVHEKLMKLLALAARGEGGERANAQAKLESMMRKHGVTIEDLKGEHARMEWFKHFRGVLEKKLMYQVIASVCGRDIDTWMSKKKRGRIGVIVTKAQQVEIELKYAAYVASLQKELEITYKAFVHTNEIFCSNEVDFPASRDPIDLEELKRLAMAMAGMKPVEVRQALHA